MWYCRLALAGLVNTLTLISAAQDSAPADSSYILADASALQIEYRADLQLRILERQHTTKSRGYQDTITLLYDDLATATNPYPQDYAARGLDTLEREEADALMLSHLDGLSLRMRLLHDTSGDMPSWTKQRLKEIRLTLPPTPCTSPSVPIPDSYYNTVGDIIFPHDRGVSLHDISWLESTISLARSPMQLPSLAELIARIPLTPEEMARIATAYAADLQAVTATDRELGYLMGSRNFPDSLSKVLSRLNHDHNPTQHLVQAYLQFLRNSMKARPCQDTKTNWVSIVRTFNEMTAAQGNDPETLTAEGLGRQQPAADRAIETSMPGSDADDLLGKIFRLRTAKDSSLLSLFGLEDRNDEMNSYGNDLVQLANRLLSAPSTCHTCAAQRAEQILLDTFELLPDGQTREQVLERVVSLLSSNPLQETMPSLWNVHFSLLLNMARPVAEEQRKQLTRLRQQDTFAPFVPSTMQAEIRRSLVGSHNSVMASYVRVDELLGTPFYAPYLQ